MLCKVVINKIINSLYLEMANRLYQFIFLGVFIELIIFVFFFYFNDAIEDVFRLSARYTGRISFGLYLLMFYHFINEKLKGTSLQNTYLWGMVFCVLHIIHFAYLSAAVYLNNLPIIPHKVAGGVFGLPCNCDISILYDENKTIRNSFDIFLLCGLCNGDDFFSSDSRGV